MARTITHPEARDLLRRMDATDDPDELMAIRDEAMAWLDRNPGAPEGDQIDFACVAIDAKNFAVDADTS